MIHKYNSHRTLLARMAREINIVNGMALTVYDLDYKDTETYTKFVRSLN